MVSKMCTNTVPKSYTVFNAEDLETIYQDICEEELIKYFNEMVNELNIDEDEEYKQLLATTIEDVRAKAEMYGWRIEEVNSNKNREVISIIEQSLKFNVSWNGCTRREDRKSYYNFSIKPLYMDNVDYLIQCSCDLMTPSGYSDNGRKTVVRFRINKQSFTDIDNLAKYVVRNSIRGLEIHTNNRLNWNFEYIKY